MFCKKKEDRAVSLILFFRFYFFVNPNAFAF